MRGISFLRGWLIVLAAICFPTGMLHAQNDSNTAQPELLAVVNGVAITHAQLDTELLLLHSEMALDPRVPGREDSLELESDLLKVMIERELIRQAVKAKEIRIPTRRVDQAFQEVKDIFSDNARFLKYLTDIGLDEVGLRERLNEGLKIQQLLHNEVTRSIRVKTAELHDHYERFSDDFIQPSQVRARHILIAVGTERTPEQAMLEIQSLELKLSQGADFAVLALDRSDCPSKNTGGDLGFFTFSQVVPEFAEAAFALQPGQISGIVKTRFGYHLIQVLERKPSARIPFRDVREKIERTIRRNKENRAITQYLATLKSEAVIQRFSAVQ